MRHTSLLERLRTVCMGLPETTEKRSHGEPAWFAGGKMFAMFDNNHHRSGHIGVWCAATHDAQDVLVRVNPHVYFVPPYVGHRGWIGIRLDGGVDWNELTEIVEEAYRRVAPKRLVARLPDRA